MAFSPAHSIFLRAFLETEAGFQFIKELRANRPEIGNEQTIEATALKARDAKGWEKCIELILEFSVITQTPQIEAGYLSEEKPKNQ